MKKTIITLTLLLLCILCGCSGEHTSGDWVYTVKDGNACIVGYKNKTDSIVIPEKLDKHTVTELGDTLFAKEQTETKSIIIPPTVESIGDATFFNCQSITDIVIPASVKKIGERAFYGCKNLNNVIFEGEIFDIHSSAFHATPWYDNMPDGVVYIGNLAYTVKGYMENCYIKEGTTHIKFGGVDCRNIFIPASVKEIMPYAFASTDIANVTIGEGDEPLLIGDYAFSKCDRLQSFNFPRRLRKIGAYAFEITPFSAVTIPSNIVEIGKGAFSNCKSISYVAIEGGLKKLPDYAFYGCGGLETVDISEGVEYIGLRAFSQCPKLLNVTLPDSLKRMASNAFWLNKRTEPEYIHIHSLKDSYGEIFAHNHKITFVEKEM